MAKVSYVDILNSEYALLRAGLQPGNRFAYSRIAKKTTLFSRKKVKGLTQRSLLPQIAEAWNALTTLQKEAWSSAGNQSNLNGYRLFVQDKSARIKNDLPGNSTPSLLHQSWVGQIHIEDPASRIKIVQLHPRNYYNLRKVAGTKSQYSPILITEDFALPFEISLNYKSNLTALSENAFAKFYASIWYSYQGVNLHRNIEIDFDLVSDWKSDIINIDELETIIIGYNLYIEIFDMQGDLLFDNVRAYHSGQNWCRDPFCLDINQGFTKIFYQIPKHWAGEIVPEGAIYESTFV